MSATSPRPSRWSGPSPAAQAQELHAPRSPTSSSGCRRPAAPTGRRVLARLLDQARHPGPLRHHQAGHRRPAHRRLGAARQAGARRFRRASTSPRSRSSGTGWRRPTTACSPGSRARPPKPESAAEALFRPVMLSHPVEDSDLARLDPADYAAEWKWDGIRVQAVSRGRHRAGSIRAPATMCPAPSPIWSTRWISTPRSTASCWSGDRPTGTGTLLRPAAAAEPQDRVAQDARTLPGLRALLRPAAAGRRGSRGPCPSPSGASGSRIFVATLDPARFDLSPLRSLRRLGRARRDAPAPAASGHRRRHAEAARFGLSRRAAEGPLVQVEARSAHGRRRADVRAARPRQALELLFRLHVRRLGRSRKARRSWCRSARPISASPTRSCKQIDKYVRDNTIERFGPVRSVRADREQGLVLEVAFEGLNRSTAAQIRRRHALPAHLPPALGQAARRGRPFGDADGDAGRIVPAKFNLSPSLRVKNA